MCDNFVNINKKLYLFVFCIQCAILHMVQIEGFIMDSLDVRALAKINIGLDVLGTLPNGYHEVSMIMQTVNLFDKLHISKTHDGEITLETNLKYLPVNDDNLCIKAARLLKEEFNIKEGIHIELDKHIPVAAGMAGGSTDGAAVLYAVNKMFGLKLKSKDLMKRGLTLGADVPYCIMRGTALAEGIGEKLKSIPPMVKCPVIIAKPAVSVSTKTVYQNLDAQFDKVIHPDISGIISDIRRKDLPAICEHMGNVLEEVTIPMHPIIADIKANLLNNGAMGAMMSGSGPTVFAFFEDEATAKRAKDVLSETGLVKQLYLTTIYNTRTK